MAMPGNRRAAKYDTGRAVLEYLREPIYDRKQLAAGTAQSVTFFKTFLGGTLRDTNMTSDGSLAAPHTFDAFGVSIFVQQGTAVADLERLMNEAYFEFKLSSKPYLRTMYHMIPAAAGLTGVAATTVTATTILELQNGIGSPLVYLPLDLEGEPLHIPSQQDFQATLTTVNTVAFTATIDLWCYLHGILGRPA